jgi:hypothetical protein
MPPQLDHIILLVPYSYLTSPPEWISQNFTLSPGGRHGDNKTENKLVLFRDGTYLELIAFINDDPSKRQGHWWDKPFGVVDFAYMPNGSLDYDALIQRLEATGTGIGYAPTKEGGRQTDGHDIRWKVTFPSGIARGNVPFFCEDVTTRSWRVPLTEENTTHPCGAVGVGGVLLEIQEELFEKLDRANAAVLDVERSAEGVYEVDVPNPVDGVKKPTIRLQQAAPDSKKELALTMILQTGEKGGAARDPISERVGEDGLISIAFE